MNKKTTLFVVIAILSSAIGIYVGTQKLAPTMPLDPAVAKLMQTPLPDADNQPHRLSDWKGKILLVNFWAPWCPPCVAEMPELVELQQELAGKNLQIVGIGVDSPSNIKQFAEKHQIGFPLLVAGMQGTELSRELGNQAGGLPFTVLLDASGQVRQTYLGKLNMDKLRSDLTGL
jgi:thiol-disulfide isomerase/thioredoxin